MAASVTTDTIIPEVFLSYMVEQTAEKSALFQSGIVETVPALAMGEGGSQVQMPFWQDLSGAAQILDSGTDLNVTAYTGQKDVAIVHGLANVYGATDLAASLAGSDPTRVLADRLIDKWNRDFQAVLINTLSGAMGAVTDNVLDISGLTGAASDFDGESFIDAKAKLGDQSGRLTGVAVHGDTYHAMLKQDLIDFIPDSEGKMSIPTYQGHQVIVDDTMPYVSTGGIYTSYLFGAGAIGYAERPHKTVLEFQREGLKGGGEEYAISRRLFVLHPRGVAWTPASGVPAKDTPNSTELADSGNWTQRYESKNIKIVQFKHTLAS